MATAGPIKIRSLHFFPAVPRKRYVKRLIELARLLKFSTSSKWLLLSALVGVIAGCGAILFKWLDQAVAWLALSSLAGLNVGEAHGEHSYFLPFDTTFSPWMIVFVMSVGGLLSGVIVYSLAPEAEGHGTDAAIDAFHNRGGVIRSRIPFVKTVASAITLGSGGSAGREGPIAQIGAGFGSWLATRLQLSPRDRRILVAVGMGAGVGAIFRAPLAGAIFAGEILYSEAEMEADVIVPAATASIVAYSLFTQSLPPEIRYQPMFGSELSHTLGSPLELLPYALLAFVLVGVGYVYVRTFYGIHDLFQRLPIVPHLRPAIGAMLAGLVGVGLYYAMGENLDALAVLGSGYGVLQKTLDFDPAMTIQLLVAISLIKIVTTSLTIGSGGSGGVFGPSMVIGGCIGAAFGHTAHQFVPALVPHPEAYAVVGMAGFFSGVARSPISTIIMVRAMTGDFGLLVPSMLVSTLAFVSSGNWNLYRKQVPTRMESPAHRGDFLIDVLEGLRVEDVYWKDRRVMRVPEWATLDDIVHRLAKTNQHYFPVIDKEGRMVGVFSDDDVRAYLYDETLWRLANARDVMISDFVQVSPDEDLNTAMQKFTASNLDELPVIDEREPGKLLGFLRRKETIAAYNRRILEHRQQEGMA